MIGTRTLTLLALSVGLLGTARAQDITSVSPAEGTLGTVLTIDGSGFGTNKPKVFLLDPVTNKKYVLKVTAYGDDSVTAEIKKVVAGTLDLVVQPKGGVQIVEAAAFEGRAPAITGIVEQLGGAELTQAEPNQEFTVVGDFFGTKKGKVKIGGKPAKVVSWTPGGAVGDGLSGTDVAVLRMPAKLANGLWDIAFANKVGADEDEQITMFGSTVKIGKTNLDLTFNGEAVKFKFTPAVQIAPAGAFIMYGTTATNPSKTFLIIVPFDMINDTAPKTVNNINSTILSAVYVETGKLTLADFKQGKIPPVAAYSAGFGSGAISVQINASSAGQVAGTISATLPKLLGDTFNPPHANQQVIEGSFVFEP